MSSATSSIISAPTNIDDQEWISPTIRTKLLDYTDLPQLWWLAVKTYVEVLISTFRSDPRAAIFSFSELRGEAFGKLWLKAGNGDLTIGPLRKTVPLLSSASGVILELGPGSGNLVKYISNPKVKVIYGAEPCEGLHEALKVAAEKAGIGKKYHVMDCGGQRDSLYPQLKRAGLLGAQTEGVFDTIISSKVLCCVPHLEDSVAALYDILKPGGRIIVCEHVANPWRTRKGSLIARLIQVFMMLIGWSFFLGGCNLNTKTTELLRAAADKDGGWEKEDLETLKQWGTLPFIVGELVKKS